MIDLERNALVWGIVGNLGGGKSLSAVNLAVNAMLSRFYVCSNITIDLDVVASRFNAPWVRRLYLHISLDDPDFDPYKLPTGDPRGSGGRRRVIVILDECAEWVDQYSSAKDPRIRNLWSWLRHSSKRSQDVVLVVQRQEYLNKVIRILIARWIWVDDLAVWRCPIIRMKLPFCGGLVMQNVFDRLGNRIGSVSFLSKAHWGRFYNTAECLNSYGSQHNDVYELPAIKKRKHTFLYFLFLTSQLYLFLRLYFS